MSQQGPILVVSTAKPPSFAATLDVARLFPVVESGWTDAARAVEQVQPAAVLAETSGTNAAGLAELAMRVAALSVALGERTGVVGALSIEAAAKHLNVRDIDGIVLGEGFSLRVVDAFLTVLTEDARFRNLPVVVAAGDLAPAYDLPNLEIVSGDAVQVAAIGLPLIRQHAFEAHLSRTLKAIDADGLIDAQTGLLTPEAFERDFASAIYQTQQRGGGLSVARFAFDPAHPRAQFDGARIISRLMRQMDFGAAQDDGSVVVVFAEADLKSAHAIARRLSSVMRHTSHGQRDARSEPTVTVATLLPNDSVKSLRSRLQEDAQRAAS